MSPSGIQPSSQSFVLPDGRPLELNLLEKQPIKKAFVWDKSDSLAGAY